MAMDTNFVANTSGEWIESLQRAWQSDPDSVPREWQAFFSGFDLCAGRGAAEQADGGPLKHSGVQSLLYRYRDIGHLLACTDPLSPCRLSHPLLELQAFGLDQSDLDTVFPTLRFMNHQATLRELLDTLRETYCREIGVEFMHIPQPDERQWLIDHMEPCRNRTVFPPEQKLHLLEKLHEAALFEAFLHRRFIGQKRFSLEGGEVLIPVLDALVRACPESGISDLIMGMAHRGRLNVLANIFGKPLENIFAEFRDSDPAGIIGEGDVKYHKGYSADLDLPGGTVHITIAANPSHLEAVNPVVEGKCRARQDVCGAGAESKVLPLLIHGDAAFAGQGSIMETLNLSRLDGYRTGGTIHIVLNNQIGFTTLPMDSRSTRYATDVAKMLACPIFHVQGESPEAAVHAVRLALHYRQTFGRDAVVELICYRRHGHNEGDEPAFTQPLMYSGISGRPPVNRIYANTLEAEGFDPGTMAAMERKISERLEMAMTTEPKGRVVGFRDRWSAVSREYSREPVATGVPAARLVELSAQLTELPPGFSPHSKILGMLRKRHESVEKRNGLDWGTAETLAYATLLEEGFPIRLSGQDSQRGTFNHRHCVLHDMNTPESYTPLSRFGSDGVRFQAWNSPLSEFGVLGFDYGYSVESPAGLTIWEAQFGDFANGAQVIIDQFIAGGEVKWNRASGLTLLLPHGYEGQGAEHSSARIERYLQLCARENMLVACPSTPAQIFHLLRRQVKQSFRKPLVVFTPKSLLRHPVCVSDLAELAEGSFREVIADVKEPETVSKILMCTGKIYYDLVEEREKRNAVTVGILRIEQLYPLRLDLIDGYLKRLPPNLCYSWVQEEPANMGAWTFIRPLLEPLCGPLRYAGRPADCIPAVSSHHLHAEEQAAVVKAAFDDC